MKFRKWVPIRDSEFDNLSSSEGCQKWDSVLNLLKKGRMGKRGSHFPLCNEFSNNSDLFIEFAIQFFRYF